VVSGTRTSDEAGAIWNWLLIEEDRSWGVHSPSYMQGLLQSSIDFLNLPAPPAPVAGAAPLVSRPSGDAGASR
jgi:hypothetical protein